MQRSTKTWYFLRKFIAVSISGMLIFSGAAHSLTPPALVHNPSDIFSGSNKEFEKKVKRFGKEIYEKSTLTKWESISPTRLVMQWAMKSEYTKKQILSFIDVLPKLKNRSIIQHMQEYFPVNDTRLPVLLRRLVSVAGWVTSVPFVKHITVPITAQIIKSSIKFFANTFFAGQTKKKVEKKLKTLKQAGLTHTIDKLGEASLTGDEAEDYVNKYLDLLSVPGIENVSLKLTSVCPAIAFDPINPDGAINAVIEPLREIVRKAGKDVAVNIDMEKYSCKQITLDVFEQILKEDEFKDYDKLGIVIQAYLKDSGKDLKRLIKFALENNRKFTVRLVKGAYWEEEKRISDANQWDMPVYEHKYETDRNYEELSYLLLNHWEYVRPAFASHNIRSIANAIMYAAENKISKDKYEIQMLYGMGDQFKRFFAKEGYTVRVYTPYGALVPGMAYLMRRILENTSNDSFLRQAYLDKKEIERLLLSPDEQEALAKLEPQAVAAEQESEEVAVSKPEKMPVIRTFKAGGRPALTKRANKAKEVFEQYGFTTWETRIHYVNRLLDLIKNDRTADASVITEVLGEHKDFIEKVLRDARALIQSVPGERNTYEYNPIGPGLIVLDKDPSREDLFKMLCAPLITGNTAVVCFTNNVSAETIASVKAFIGFCEKAGFCQYTIQIMDVPVANIKNANSTVIEWISYHGHDAAMRKYRISVLAYFQINNSILRFIHQITPDYPLEFLYAKSIAENTARRGYAPEYGVEGGHLRGFKNAPPVDFRDRKNHARMREALELVGKEIKDADKRQPYPLIIGDEKCSLDYDDVVISHNPNQPSQIVGRTYSAKEEHVKIAETEARKAFVSWSKKSAEKRAGYLHKAGRLMRKKRFELAALQVYEVGKTWREALGDVNEAIDFVEYYARLAVFNEEKDKKIKGCKRVPNGVCAVIPPWNFPLAILTGMVVGAIATGNTVLLKPSSDSPITGYKLMEILADKEVGLPPGVVNFLPGSGRDIGDDLIKHSDMPAFTGSEKVGMEIIKKYNTKESVHKVVAEMGGKDTLIISNSADLDVGVMCVLQSAFGYSGQKCSACSRVIVMEDIYDEFLRRLKGAAAVLKVGDPKDPSTDMGPLINQDAQEKVLGFVKRGRNAKSKAEGVKVLIDRSQEKDFPQAGHYVGPTVFYDVPRHHELAQEEIFGPVLTVIKAKDFADALDIANDTRYALTGGIVTRTPSEIKAVKRFFNVGNLYINRVITGAVVEWQPFGGYKRSGLGSKAGGPDYLYWFMHWEPADEAGPEEVPKESSAVASL